MAVGRSLPLSCVSLAIGAAACVNGARPRDPVPYGVPLPQKSPPSITAPACGEEFTYCELRSARGEQIAGQCLQGHCVSRKQCARDCGLRTSARVLRQQLGVPETIDTLPRPESWYTQAEESLRSNWTRSLPPLRECLRQCALQGKLWRWFPPEFVICSWPAHCEGQAVPQCRQSHRGASGESLLVAAHDGNPCLTGDSDAEGRCLLGYCTPPKDWARSCGRAAGQLLWDTWESTAGKIERSRHPKPASTTTSSHRPASPARFWHWAAIDPFLHCIARENEKDALEQVRKYAGGGWSTRWPESALPWKPGESLEEHQSRLPKSEAAHLDWRLPARLQPAEPAAQSPEPALSHEGDGAQPASPVEKE